MSLCCGEALIDMLLQDMGSGRPTWSAFPGGVVFQSAIAAAAMGLRNLGPARCFDGVDKSKARFLVRLHESGHFRVKKGEAMTSPTLADAIADGIKAASIAVERSRSQAPTRGEIDTHAPQG